MSGITLSDFRVYTGDRGNYDQNREQGHLCDSFHWLRVVMWSDDHVLSVTPLMVPLIGLIQPEVRDSTRSKPPHSFEAISEFGIPVYGLPVNLAYLSKTHVLKISHQPSWLCDKKTLWDSPIITPNQGCLPCRKKSNMAWQSMWVLTVKQSNPQVAMTMQSEIT